MFTQKFSKYACDGDTITTEVEGFAITATIEHDSDSGAPWENEDGHGPVSDWTSRDKNPCERVLIEDRGSKRYYDYAEAIKIANRDGWDAPPYKQGTKGEQAVRAVERDFENLKAWCDNEWTYCGIVLSVSKNGIELTDHAASLWGIELNYPNSDNDYLNEVANDLLDEAIEQGKAEIVRVCKALC